MLEKRASTPLAVVGVWVTCVGLKTWGCQAQLCSSRCCVSFGLQGFHLQDCGFFLSPSCGGAYNIKELGGVTKID